LEPTARFVGAIVTTRSNSDGGFRVEREEPVIVSRTVAWYTRVGLAGPRSFARDVAQCTPREQEVKP
jgi:hypothetical protein